MTLTPAQQRLIDNARKRSDYRVITFGTPQKTIAKLESLGLIVKVYQESDEDAKRLFNSLGEATLTLTELQSINCRDARLTKCGDSIQWIIRQLQATQYVLTNAASHPVS